MEDEAVGERTRAKTRFLRDRLKHLCDTLPKFKYDDQPGVSKAHTSHELSMGGGGLDNSTNRGHTTSPIRHSIRRSISFERIKDSEFNPYEMLNQLASSGSEPILNKIGQLEEGSEKYLRDFDDFLDRALNKEIAKHLSSKPREEAGAKHLSVKSIEEAGDINLRLETSGSEGEEKTAASLNSGKNIKKKPRYKKKALHPGQPLITKFTAQNSQDEDDATQEQVKDISWHNQDIANSTPHRNPMENIGAEQPGGRQSLHEELESKREMEQSSILLMLNDEEENTAVDTSKGPIAELLNKLDEEKGEEEEPENEDDHLTSILKCQFERMNNRMMVEQRKLQEDLLSTIQAEIAARFDDQSNKFKVKMSKYMAEELIKWKSQTRQKTDQIELETIKNRNRLDEIDSCEKEIVSTLEFFAKEYQDTRVWKLEHCKREERKMQTFECLINTVRELQEQMVKVQLDCNRNDRNWRKKNLRVSNVKEEEEEDSKKIIVDMIAQHNLLPHCKSRHEIMGEIDEIYRQGKKDPKITRQIVVVMRTISCKNTILRLSKYKRTAERLKPIFMQEDLTSQDLVVKREANDFINQAFNEGQKPRFIEGNVKIIDKDGKSSEISREVIQKYNRLRYKRQHDEKRHKFPTLKTDKHDKEPYKIEPLQPSITKLETFMQEERAREYKDKLLKVEGENMEEFKRLKRRQNKRD
jgi:hypothetical protein